MSQFITHLYSGRAYSSEETISFSNNPLTHFADANYIKVLLSLQELVKYGLRPCEAAALPL